MEKPQDAKETGSVTVRREGEGGGGAEAGGTQRNPTFIINAGLLEHGLFQVPALIPPPIGTQDLCWNEMEQM